MANTHFKNVGDYFSEADSFVIPNYQRGYKWGVPDPDKGNTCAVEVLMDNLWDAFYSNSLSGYFLQGVTVAEPEPGRVLLIDGQQRTTTLFLLLRYLGQHSYLVTSTGKLKLSYEIRPDTQHFLEHTCELRPDPVADPDVQDIYYLKQAQQKIKNKLEGKESFLKDFTDFVLRRVKMLYICIDQDKATRTFTMMNGQKALIKPEELIKADLLRLVAMKASKGPSVLSDNNKPEGFRSAAEIAQDWDTNALRSKYAREWDKWQNWWNRSDIKDFFWSGDVPLGLLIRYHYLRNRSRKEQHFSFINFRLKFLGPTEGVAIPNLKRVAKDTFGELRKLQKSFEDLYYNNDSYNYLGLALRCGLDKFEVINYFLSNKGNKKELERYAKWALIGCTHKVTEEKNYDAYNQKVNQTKSSLASKDIYNENPDLAGLQLLRLNVFLDIALNRKFDFSIYDKKSLEHIYPKSWEKVEGSRLEFSEEEHSQYSVHCIGNLVLLDTRTNSEFSARTFPEKKRLYFNLDNAKWSLKLLHSISVFSQNEWNKNSIIENKKHFIKNFETSYEIHA